VANAREVETKLRVPNPADLRSRLRDLRAVQIVPRTYESNILYDTPAKKFLNSDRMLRLRFEQPARHAARAPFPHPGPAILTYKEPIAQPGRPKATLGNPKSKPRLKIREELEVHIPDALQLSRLLEALGLRPAFRYEKFRTTFALPGIPLLKIELDETPLGLFLELEGSPRDIERAASLLGYRSRDFIASSYGALYLADCRRRRKKPSHLVFSRKKLCKLAFSS
jgi:adenylate cyclase class 2